MLGDANYPMVAPLHLRYAGAFLKEVTSEEAKALSREWSKRRDAAHAQPNMRGVGSA
jgi:hypothetical protein